MIAPMQDNDDDTINNQEIAPKSALDEQVAAAIEGRRSVGQRLRTYFLTGIVVVAPISITIYLTYLFLNLVDTTVAQILPAEFYASVYGGATIPGIGVIVALVFFVTVGWLATNVLGRVIISISEYVLNKMPIIRTLYNGTKQIFETVMASKSSTFREVVLLEYPRKGLWAMGFVAGTADGEAKKAVSGGADIEIINVYVPTAPNPTSGFVLFVPKSDLVYMDMPVEQAFKFIVSGGILNPQEADAAESAKPKKIRKKKKT